MGLLCKSNDTKKVQNGIKIDFFQIEQASLTNFGVGKPILGSKMGYEQEITNLPGPEWP